MAEAINTKFTYVIEPEERSDSLAYGQLLEDLVARTPASARATVRVVTTVPEGGGAPKRESGYPDDAMAIFGAAVLAFGDVELATDWMESPLESLAGGTPRDLSLTEAGRQKLREILLRIEHGMY